jgi:PPIC-type PPIASE domain
VKFLLPLFLVLDGVACAGREQPPETAWVPEPAPDLGAVVARVGSVPIHAREVEAQMSRSKSTRREALEDLISLHLLAQRAHREIPFVPDWFDPELRSALAERLIDRDIWPQIQRDSVPDQELRAIYQAAISTFVHPRLVDAGFLIVFTGPRMKPAARAERGQAAKALAAAVALRRIAGPEDFEAIARDPDWAARNVSFRRTLQSPDQPFSRKVGAEVVKLKAAGDTTPLIEDTDGFFIATYAGEQPPMDVPFAQVREELRQRYYDRWRAQRLEELSRKLAEGHRVESHPQLLNPGEPGHGS